MKWPSNKSGASDRRPSMAPGGERRAARWCWRPAFMAVALVCGAALAGAAGGKPGGTLDQSFGAAGKVVIDFGGASEEFQDVAVQPDGKVVAAGRVTAADGSSSGVLVRLNRDGTPDRGFGDHG